MNLYFLVEGKRTEKKVYPKWISHIIPELNEVKYAFEASDNNFYIFTGNGYPSLLNNHLKNSIAEVNELNFDYLVLCLDADDIGVFKREKEVEKFISEENLKLNSASLVIIVQDKCIESWFLGNRKVYSAQPNSVELRKYNEFYNVKVDDPEMMPLIGGVDSIGAFHHDYLKEMLKERNIQYSKRKPNGVIEKTYLEQLIQRNNNTRHLASFGSFLSFCHKLKKEISS